MSTSTDDQETLGRLRAVSGSGALRRWRLFHATGRQFNASPRFGLRSWPRGKLPASRRMPFVGNVAFPTAYEGLATIAPNGMDQVDQTVDEATMNSANGGVATGTSGPEMYSVLCSSRCNAGHAVSTGGNWLGMDHVAVAPFRSDAPQGCFNPGRQRHMVMIATDMVCAVPHGDTGGSRWSRVRFIRVAPKGQWAALPRKIPQHGMRSDGGRRVVAANFR